MLRLALLFLAATAVTASRQQMVDYLASVYSAPTTSEWNALSDNQVADFFNKLTFYYPGAPTGLSSWNAMYPNGRTVSHPYAGTECDCLHIQLADCKKFNPSSTCTYWPVTSYLNMDFVAQWGESGIPSHSWYEGLTFPGEWAFPQSCNDYSLSSQIYGFRNHVWLYPTTGVGVWWNTGRTASAWNKVDWLLKFGLNKQGLGSTTTEVMDKLAETTCPGYQTRGNARCESCPYSATGSTSRCCCHGAGLNLGTQVIAIYQDMKRSNPSTTWNDALDKTAEQYQQGKEGQQTWNAFPYGTFFGYRNLLDPFFINIQASESYDTVQFTREPQHSGGSGTPSDPAYAFEILAANPNWNYNYNTMCQDQSTIGVLNPLDYPNYVDQGYISSAPNSAVQSISTWKPRAEFSKLLTLSSSSFVSNNELDRRGDLVDASDDGGDATVFILIALTVAAVVGVALGVAVMRRRRASAGFAMQTLE